MTCVVFLFQAEDGIRDLVRSRGLGDVYKRQPLDPGLLRGHGDLDRIAIREVSTLVNSARNNGPELIAPAEPKPEQAELF